MENGRMVVVAGGVGGIGSKIVDRFLANGGMIFAIDAIKRDEQPEDLAPASVFPRFSRGQFHERTDACRRWRQNQALKARDGVLAVAGEPTT
jgi:nucleoside-diphosphate-sugar epimerase